MGDEGEAETMMEAPRHNAAEGGAVGGKSWGGVCGVALGVLGVKRRPSEFWDFRDRARSQKVV